MQHRLGRFVGARPGSTVRLHTFCLLSSGVGPHWTARERGNVVLADEEVVWAAARQPTGMYILRKDGN